MAQGLSSAPLADLIQARAAVNRLVSALAAGDLVSATAADQAVADALGDHYDVDSYDDIAALSCAMAERAGSDQWQGTAVAFLVEVHEVDPEDITTWASVPEEFLEDLRYEIANHA